MTTAGQVFGYELVVSGYVYLETPLALAHTT